MIVRKKMTHTHEDLCVLFIKHNQLSDFVTRNQMKGAHLCHQHSTLCVSDYCLVFFCLN